MRAGADGCRRAEALPGQLRSRPLSATLAAARRAAAGAGVTRLADLSGLAPYRLPVFQAVRPLGRLFSVAQGKGVTPMAAQVSALLEAVETDCAERLEPQGPLRPLTMLDPATQRLWVDRGDPLTIRIDPDVPRAWMPGRDLLSGAAVHIPWELLSLDTTRIAPSDIRASSVGLATGNDPVEAHAAGVAELLEHELDAHFEYLSPVGKRAAALDLDSVTDPAAHTLLRRLHRRGVDVRVWSVGQDHGLAAFRCALIDRSRAAPAVPVGGNGCHPDRSIALLRAVTEAVQSHITMIAGARDDLRPDHYRDGRARTAALLIGTLGFGATPLQWDDIPHRPARDAQETLDVLLDRCARLDAAVVAFTHKPPDPDLAVVHCLAPALRDLGRIERSPVPVTPPVAPAIIRRRRRPVLFVGPTLGAAEIPATIERRPPALCGDLAALLADPPPAVGLIDGCFEIGPTVWHKEILDLLAHGVPVFGGASLGAIRAAELAPFGMTGIGALYQAYADGSLTRDDAVMLSHAPAALGHRPVSLALVDAEAALDRAGLPPRVDRALRRIARTTDFRERTWPLCLARYAERHGQPAPIDAAALEAVSDRKRRDALLLVAALLGPCATPSRPRPPLSAHYRAMLSNRAPAHFPDRPSSAPHAPAD